jgi:hypothetical protein
VNPAGAVILASFPTVLTAIFFVRALAISRMIGNASDHLAGIESSFGLDNRLGWDSHWWYVRTSSKRFGFSSGPLDGWLVLYWVFLVFGNGIVTSVIPASMYTKSR